MTKKLTYAVIMEDDNGQIIQTFKTLEQAKGFYEIAESGVEAKIENTPQPAPWCPDGFTVEKDNGNYTEEPSKISFKQASAAEENNKEALNSNTLKYFLDHQDKTPTDWKGRYVYFFGTVLRDSRGGRYVLCLCWGDGAWRWGYRWLVNAFYAQSQSAVAGK